MPDVWLEDRVAMAAIQRNRVVHAACCPVRLAPSAEPPPRVGLVLDDSRGIMAAHQPLPRACWDRAAQVPHVLFLLALC